MKPALRKIYRNPLLAAVVFPVRAAYRLGKKGIKKFFHNPKSFAFAQRLGMALACAGLVAAGIGFAPFGPVITKALIWIAMQVPINIFKDSALRALKKEWAHIQKSQHRLKIRPRTLGVAAAIASIGSVAVYFVGLPVVGGAALNIGLLATRNIPLLATSVLRGRVKGQLVKAIKTEELKEMGGVQVPVINEKQILHSFHQMHPDTRKKVFETLHQKFGAEFREAVKALEHPVAAIEQQNAKQPVTRVQRALKS